jgi:hypothetical protein
MFLFTWPILSSIIITEICECLRAEYFKRMGEKRRIKTAWGIRILSLFTLIPDLSIIMFVYIRQLCGIRKCQWSALLYDTI